MEQTVLAET